MSPVSGMYPIIVATPVIGLGVYCIAQIALARSWRGRTPYQSLAVGFVFGLVAVGMLAGWSACCMAAPPMDRIGYMTLDILTYLALAFGYFNFVNLTVASLRIRLLEELRAAGGTLPSTNLLATYDSRHVVAIRLARLVRAGHLLEKHGRLHIGRLPFLIVARIFEVLRWFIIGRTGKGRP